MPFDQPPDYTLVLMSALSVYMSMRQLIFGSGPYSHHLTIEMHMFTYQRVVEIHAHDTIFDFYYAPLHPVSF